MKVPNYLQRLLNSRKIVETIARKPGQWYQHSAHGIYQYTSGTKPLAISPYGIEKVFELKRS